jgi:hypothetical protein
MILEKQKTNKITIDLTGPQGNAFVLLGIARDLCLKTKTDWDTVHTEMTSGDYENLVQTLDKYFGEIIIMYK